MQARERLINDNQVVIKSIRTDEFAKEICKMRNKMSQVELWGAPTFKRKADSVEPWKEREAGKWEVTEGKERESLPRWKTSWQGGWSVQRD